MTSPREAISRGSKSFFLASHFFPTPVRHDVWSLYRWCRHCDDQIDLVEPPQSAGPALQTIHSHTIAALNGKANDPVFADFGAVCDKHQILSQYPMELLRGLNQDVQSARFDTLEEVETYSYRVAGVVGIMMSSILGSQNSAALAHAAALGNAMQLTNIARDVAEDFSRGRIYLPLDWLRDEGCTSDKLMSFENRSALFRVVLRLLTRADDLYVHGLKGLKYLPLRSAMAVGAAAEIYRRIGHKLRAKGPGALERRIYVNLGEKLYLSFRGMIIALRSRQ